MLANPLNAYWLLLAIPIIGLYLLRIRRRREVVTTAMFWSQVLRETPPRAWWRRLRYPLSLLLQLLLLVLLVLALCDPLRSGSEEAARTLVIVLDNSASMQATDVAPSRFAWAKRQAQSWVADLQENDRCAIITAASPAHVVVGLTSHPRPLHRALASIDVTDSPTDLTHAVRLARQVLQERAAARIIVLTDRTIPGESDDAHDASADSIADRQPTTVDWYSCGMPTANVGITQWQVRREVADPTSFQAMIEIANQSEESAACRLSIELNGELLDTIPLQLEPNQFWQRSLEYASQVGGQLSARVEHPDRLAIDNVAVALVPAGVEQPVILYPGGNLFLKSVLASIPLISVRETTQLNDPPPANSIVICRDTELPDPLPQRLLVIQPKGDSPLWERDATDVAVDTVVGDRDAESSLLRHVDLSQVVLRDVQPIELSAGFKAIASSVEESPVYAARISNGQRTLVLNLSLERGDLPLRTAFPLLMANAIQWLQQSGGEWSPGVRTGESATLSWEALRSSLGPTTDERQLDQSRLRLVSPSGLVRPLYSSAEDCYLGTLDQTGWWSIESAVQTGEGSDQHSTDQFTLLARVACNLNDRSESDLRGEAAAPTGDEARFVARRPWWQSLVMIGLVLSAVEWFLYQRRWIE